MMLLPFSPVAVRSKISRTTGAVALDNFMKFCIQKATGVDLDKLIGNNDKLRT